MLYKFWRKENTYPCVIYGINVGEELVKFVNSKENFAFTTAPELHPTC